MKERAAAARSSIAKLSAALCALLMVACAPETPTPAQKRDALLVDTPRALAQATSDGEDWILHGRTYSEQRFSPLDQVNTGNADRLGLAWQLDLATLRGLEATPLIVDGVMFVTGSWSRVFAIDTRKRALLWSYDPQVPGASAFNGCCDVVNRGVAVWQGRVISATFDGRLIALDARTGALQWSVDTIADRSLPYSITGAPRVVKDKVIIGNAGAEFGVRGYVSAYEAATGKLVWRFFTVPKQAEGPFEHPELERAAATWDTTTADWHGKGGGTVWDSMAYDPELDTLFVGTGNAPWTPAVPNPGEGDKLFTASILALDPATGRMKWHYQQTPGDRWDFTATQHMILAELELDGRMRKVLMQAPKNGFFYILDRETGELLSAEKYATVTWASHVDMKTGRPVLTAHARYWDGNRETLIYPWVAGAHNWHPMSYSPRTGLVYIPAQQAWWVHSSKRVTHFDEQTKNFDALLAEQKLLPTRGYLRAWDPVKHRVAWEVEYPTLANGGTLVTAGDVVFQGSTDGNFSVYDAKDGRLLKRIFTGTGIIAPPVTYRVDGTQYIAVLAGYGGATFFMMDEATAARKYVNQGRLLVFALDGGAVPLPQLKAVAADTTRQFKVNVPRSEIERGITLYRNNCGRCHGMLTSKALLPDLRELSDEKHRVFETIVLGGALQPLGMASFEGLLTSKDVLAIQGALLYLRDHPDQSHAGGSARALDARPGY